MFVTTKVSAPPRRGSPVAATGTLAAPPCRSHARKCYYKLKMNIIFCPLTSRIRGQLRSMDSLQIRSLWKTCFCLSKTEMNGNDFNYHQKAVSSPAVGSDTLGPRLPSSPCQVLVHQLLMSHRTPLQPLWALFGATPPTSEGVLPVQMIHQFRVMRMHGRKRTPTHLSPHM